MRRQINWGKENEGHRDKQSEKLRGRERERLTDRQTDRRKSSQAGLIRYIDNCQRKV